jgi:lipoic acid synthetase
MHLPKWFKMKMSGIRPTQNILRRYALHSVCEEARCPNKSHCFSIPTATFLILGDTCTRSCAFCSVKSGIPREVNTHEPARIVEAARLMGLKYIVITSVTRDDLYDGGASHFADVIKAIKNNLVNVKVEVLTPDFSGNIEALKIVLSAQPDVFGHNIETVKRLYPVVRPQADYNLSLSILKNSSDTFSSVKVKSGFMLGLGETYDEIVELLDHIRETGCSFVTIGQYLKPAKRNIPVVEYIKPEEFERLQEMALSMGFDYVASGPLVRSSMNAHEAFNLADK